MRHGSLQALGEALSLGVMRSGGRGGEGSGQGPDVTGFFHAQCVVCVSRRKAHHDEHLLCCLQLAGIPASSHKHVPALQPTSPYHPLLTQTPPQAR